MIKKIIRERIEEERMGRTSFMSTKTGDSMFGLQR